MKFLRILLITVLLLACLGGAFAYWMYRELRTPNAHASATEYIEIPRGSS
ncbi:MAG: endolytic transglycosylase MltG, partial [Pyrinomonadaceae bacterium]|nr:endolytic transglycosylase MltG [Pyrinomonadaceae bacterium]